MQGKLAQVRSALSGASVVRAIMRGSGGRGTALGVACVTRSSPRIAPAVTGPGSALCFAVLLGVAFGSAFHAPRAGPRSRLRWAAAGAATALVSSSGWAVSHHERGHALDSALRPRQSVVALVLPPGVLHRRDVSRGPVSRSPSSPSCDGLYPDDAAREGAGVISASSARPRSLRIRCSARGAARGNGSPRAWMRMSADRAGESAPWASPLAALGDRSSG